MDVKLICMDLDGTLFGDMGVIPDINKEALRACEKKGIRLALVSGRGYSLMKTIGEEIGIHPIIASANGARIDLADDGGTIFEGVFDEARAKYIAELLLDEGVNFEVYTRGVNYVANPELMPERHKRSLNLNVAAGGLQVVYDEKRLMDEGVKAAYKIVMFTEYPEVVDRMRAFLDEKGIEHCSSGSRNIEMMPDGIGKGFALMKIAGHFGIDRRDTMAFGDFTNDLSMLMASGHPVAMGNALDVVKKEAEIIAPVNTEGGLGRVIYEYVLKEKYYR